VVDKILWEHELFGHQRFLMQLDIGGQPYAMVARAIELLATEVKPRVQQALGAFPLPRPRLFPELNHEHRTHCFHHPGPPAHRVHPARRWPLLLHGLEPATRLGQDGGLPARHRREPAAAAPRHRDGVSPLAGGRLRRHRGAQPELIYDYYGFPPHTYELKYPAPGEPALAERITALLGQAGLSSHIDARRGFDHGMFIPLMLMVPQADIPVVQLSLNVSLDPAAHLALGRALQPLRDEGVLIVGSGMSFHNMRGYGDPRFGPVSDTFDDWLTEAVEAPAAERDAALTAWAEAPMARWCHPPRAEEHLLPLMVVAGAAGADRGRKAFSDRVMETTLSAFSFG
jgi:aromatic ring-opening dioxygenase catalytic subunit (LigB family)